jgi:alpha-tubulin suppressor-like RCC1 family protein
VGRPILRVLVATHGLLALASCGGGEGSGASSSPATSVAFVAVATGGAHTCALTARGTAYCWGRDEGGQLGAPPPESCPLDSGLFPCSLVPLAVQGGLTFAQVVGGGGHTCALTADGSAYCWGNNGSGQLGNGTTTNAPMPVAVSGGLRFTSMDAGASHTCGVTGSGTAYCWGRNDRGQLGDGTTTTRLAPVPVSGRLVFQSVTAGGFIIGHTCGVTTAGAALCWGDNEKGQLGIGTHDVTAHPVPAPVSGGLTFATLTAGLGRHTCGITGAETAYCWGENPFGALGTGSTADSAVPAAVAGGLTYAQLRAGGFIGHTCGLTSRGAAYCWGDNEVGALGDGSTDDSFTPSPVADGLVFSSLDSGLRHTCGRVTAGAV